MQNTYQVTLVSGVNQIGWQFDKHLIHVGNYLLLVGLLTKPHMLLQREMFGSSSYIYKGYIISM